MSRPESNEENHNEETITYVYLPDDGIYGVISQHGAYASLVEYHEDGIKYITEVNNEDFIIIDEIGVGYLDETGDNL
jgi:nucleoside-triphosphatase THEP1